MEFLDFLVDGHRYAVNLEEVSRVIRAVEITPMAKSSALILGVINLQGEIIPVVNSPERLGLPRREIELSDQFIITKNSNKSFAIMVDKVKGIIKPSEKDIAGTSRPFTSNKYFKKVIKVNEEIIFIIDLEAFLPIEESIYIDDAGKAA